MNCLLTHNTVVTAFQRDRSVIRLSSLRRLFGSGTTLFAQSCLIIASLFFLLTHLVV